LGNYNFHKDLEVEEKNKTFICEFLGEKGYTILEDRNDYQYDLLVEKNGKQFKVELKEDFKAEETGNVAVEFHSRGKPSGISKTKAQYYVYTVHLKEKIEIVIASTRNLRYFFRESFDYRTVVGGDDGSYTKMYLIDYNTFKKLGKVYGTVND
tara:strand:- start:1143 stop:1601 length:459 start_codon:yes stop_codon:yes gene_type:complete